MAKTSPVKRLTRARAAAKAADGIDAPPRKLTTSKVTKDTSARKTQPKVESQPEEQPEPVPTKRPSTRTTTKATPLAAAPRRRVKVTPLDPPVKPQETAAEENPSNAATTKKTTTRKKTSQIEEKASTKGTQSAPEPETRLTAKPTTEKKVETGKDAAEPKTRGRPKKAATAVQPISGERKADGPRAARRTRTRANSSPENALPPVPAVTQTAAAPRKKVTFMDLPEDDKENQPIQTKKTAAKKQSATGVGMRAKPIRNPTAAAAKRKTAAASKSKDEKQAPRALTPKKITQVAKTLSEDGSDEDELNGAKTPVRDLSQSPRRPPSAAAAKMSPMKKLDFAQGLVAPKSPDRTIESASMMSPARRGPASPFKDALKESPRKGSAAFVFPSQSQTSNMAAPNLNSVQSHAMLQQSPKRLPVDNFLFTQSAKKAKSPFKASLLSSPAKRLFSPAKQRTPAAAQRIVKSTTPDAESEGDDMGTPSDIAISSHFRSSVSPQRSVRVHKLTDEELAQEQQGHLNFDDSVLNIRSPLKIATLSPVPEPSLTDEDVLPDVVDEGMPEDGSSIEDSGETMDELQAGSDPMDEDNLQSTVPEQDRIVADIDEALADHVPELGDVTVVVSAEALEAPSIVAEPRLRSSAASQILFKSSRFRDEEESSEDELAADQTPKQAPAVFRSSLTGATARSRLSSAMPGSAVRSFGFTPLAAQMSGWLAASPEKKAEIKATNGSMFSPIAAQHIDGDVQISRQSTPRMRKSFGNPQASALRRSVAGRSSLTPSMIESPYKASHFEEQMLSMDVEQQMEAETDNTNIEDLRPVEKRSEADDDLREDQALDEIVSDAEDEVVTDDDDSLDHGDGELTTDLIKFTNASDTALVDFAKLAHEADELAPEAPIMQSSESAYGDENMAPVEVENDTETDNFENDEAEDNADITPTASGEALQELIEDGSVFGSEDVLNSLQQAVETTADTSTSIAISPSRITNEAAEMLTPVRPDPSLPRYVNTIVSKVPLRPEGLVSAIKIPKKRSNSLSAADESPAKRLNFGILLPRSATTPNMSPARRIRSAAPSPAHTTPAQTSFMIDDFGDSTLDGIELPDDEMEYSDEEAQPSFSVVAATPVAENSAESSKSKSTTATPAQSRAPLQVVGGVLHGATVYVDVHTTEGADASSIYVDLLTSMGAKCVRDWRWNSRASMPNPGESTKIGITHVVYKDGGKRTLEKVRDTKGEVCCVGVNWVLNCQRENKWLDEAPYMVDQTIVPRGGSRRRKSMEPRSLINANGALSASKSRRSIQRDMTEAMKTELINTPVREAGEEVEESERELDESEMENRASRQSLGNITVATFGDDSEISSTYNSPTTTMNVQTGAVGQKEHEIGLSTPTALVNYDPATAETPAATPYLMREGSKLMQMSCPPKQTGEGLFEVEVQEKKNNHTSGSGFPASGDISEQR